MSRDFYLALISLSVSCSLFGYVTDWSLQPGACLWSPFLLFPSIPTAAADLHIRNPPTAASHMVPRQFSLQTDEVRAYGSAAAARDLFGPALIRFLVLRFSLVVRSRSCRFFFRWVIDPPKRLQAAPVTTAAAVDCWRMAVFFVAKKTRLARAWSLLVVFLVGPNGTGRDQWQQR